MLLFVFGIIFSLGLVLGAVVVTRTDFTTTAFNTNEDVSSGFYNITINNTVAALANGQVNNITQVNITFPTDFNLSRSTNGTNTNASLSLSVSNLTMSWLNLTQGVLNASVAGQIQYFWVNASGASPGIYNITVVTTNFSNTYNTNLTVRINDTTRPIVDASNITLPARSNVTGTIRLNVSVGDNSIINAVLFNVTNASGSVALLNSTNLASNSWNGSLDTRVLTDGVYNVTVIANDTYGNLSNINNSARIEIVIDNTAPVVSLSCTPSSVTRNEEVTCSCSTSDSTSGVASTSFDENPSTSETGTHTIECTATDYAGNTGSGSDEFNVDGSFNRRTSSGSSGGSSGSTTTITPTTTTSSTVQWDRTISEDSSELSTRGTVSTTVKAHERIAVKIANEVHHVGVVSVTSTSATIEVSSTPQQVTLSVGQSKNVDADGDGYYDMTVTLTSIDNGAANIMVTYLHQAVATDYTTPTTSTSNAIWWVLGIIAVVVIVVVAVMMNRKR